MNVCRYFFRCCCVFVFVLSFPNEDFFFFGFFFQLTRLFGFPNRSGFCFNNIRFAFRLYTSYIDLLAEFAVLIEYIFKTKNK